MEFNKGDKVWCFTSTIPGGSSHGVIDTNYLYLNEFEVVDGCGDAYPQFVMLQIEHGGFEPFKTLRDVCYSRKEQAMQFLMNRLSDISSELGLKLNLGN